MNEPIPAQYLRHYARVYPRAWEQADDFRSQKGQPNFDWPDWCFLPLAGSYEIVRAEAVRQGLLQSRSDPLTPALALDIMNLSAVIAWRQTQGIYRYDPDLYASLWETPLDGKIPVEVLFRLPEWCVWIETDPASDPASPSRGFFASLESDTHTQRPELRLVFDLVKPDGKNSLVGHILHLDQETLEECVSASLTESRRQATRFGKADELWKESEQSEIASGIAASLAPRLSLLLYLCTVNSEIRDARGSTKAPANPEPVKTKKGLKLFAATTPTKWDVGFRIGAALKAAAAAADVADPQGGTHASLRPHIRRAHWATYWTGPKSAPQTRVLKWLPPIPVNVELEDDLIPVIRSVS